MPRDVTTRGRWTLLVVAALLVAALTVGCGASKAEPPPRSAAQRLSAEGVRRLERGDAAGAEQMFRDALEEAELVDDLPAQAEAWNNLGALAASRHDARAAWASHASAVRLYVATGKRLPGEARARTNLGSAMLALGRRDEAKAEFERALMVADALGAPALGLYARVGLAAVALAKKDAGVAAGLARDAARAARTAADEGALTAALSVEAAAAELLGDPMRARALLEEALARDRRREQPAAVAADLRSLARLEARVGRRAEAGRYLVRLAKIERRLGALDRAEATLEEAIDLLPEGDERGLVRAELDEVRRARERGGSPD